MGKFLSICEILWANHGQIFIFGQKERVTTARNSLIFTVGAKGFEPSTPCSQSRCASRTAPYPEVCLTLAEKGGFEPPVPLAEYDSLANCWFQPLTHLSKVLRSECVCKSTPFFITSKLFCSFFLKKVVCLLSINALNVGDFLIKMM